MKADTEELILQHQNYVVALAKGIARKLPPHVEIDELIAWGQIGLIEAARRYDFASGASFETYAYCRIRGAIFDGIRRMTGLPAAARASAAFLEGADEVAAQRGGFGLVAVEADDVPRRLCEGIREIGVVAVLVRAARAAYEARTAGQDDADDGLDRCELIGRMREALSGLSKEEAEVIGMHYFEGLSMTECAERCAVHKSTISRLHARAVSSLRRRLESGPARGSRRVA